MANTFHFASSFSLSMTHQRRKGAETQRRFGRKMGSEKWNFEQEETEGTETK
jgi:hypothetical protein